MFLPGKFHGQRSLATYSPWHRVEHDWVTKHAHAYTHTHTHIMFSLSLRIFNSTAGLRSGATKGILLSNLLWQSVSQNTLMHVYTIFSHNSLKIMHAAISMNFSPCIYFMPFRLLTANRIIFFLISYKLYGIWRVAWIIVSDKLSLIESLLRAGHHKSNEQQWLIFTEGFYIPDIFISSSMILLTPRSFWYRP